MKITYVVLALAVAALIGCKDEVKSESSSSVAVSSSTVQDSVKVDSTKVDTTKKVDSVKVDTTAKK